MALTLDVFQELYRIVLRADCDGELADMDEEDVQRVLGVLSRQTYEVEIALKRIFGWWTLYEGFSPVSIGVFTLARVKIKST